MKWKKNFCFHKLENKQLRNKIGGCIKQRIHLIGLKNLGIRVKIQQKTKD